MECPIILYGVSGPSLLIESTDSMIYTPKSWYATYAHLLVALLPQRQLGLVKFVSGSKILAIQYDRSMVLCVRNTIFCKELITIIIIHRRAALYTWKKRNGSNATYSELIKIFKRADCKNYADEVRRIMQVNESDTDDSSVSGEENYLMEQPQTYPTQSTMDINYYNIKFQNRQSIS